MQLLVLRVELVVDLAELLVQRAHDEVPRLHHQIHRFVLLILTNEEEVLPAAVRDALDGLLDQLQVVDARLVELDIDVKIGQRLAVFEAGLHFVRSDGGEQLGVLPVRGAVHDCVDVEREVDVYI